jgi:hypothetical protein
MSRGDWGRGSILLRGRVCWVRFPDGMGKKRRESSGTTDKKKVRRLFERWWRARKPTGRANSRSSARRAAVGARLGVQTRNSHKASTIAPP